MLNHSYKSLGSEFFVNVSAKHIFDARLVLFNRELAQRLKLDLPDFDDELEKVIIEKFAWFKCDRGQGCKLCSEDDKAFFATRYQDSDEKSEGSALGDGRAIWVEEIIIPQPDDRFKYYDVVLKGAGITPLAWHNHPRKTHRDGLLGLTEAVHEYIYSLTAIENGIDSVEALAVIELPFTRDSTDEKAAIIVRVGNHIRFAHYRYFSENATQFEKIFEYGLKRDLGLSLDHVVNAQDVQEYLDFIVTNSAKDAAVYYDLHAVHGSPTFGNRTSNGGTIDLANFVYLDAHHGKYSYMPENANSLGGDWGQTQQFFNLFSGFIGFTKNSQFKFLQEIKPIEYFFKKFNDVFEQHLTHRWLKRLGLSEAEINILSVKSKEYFYEITKSIYEAEGTKRIKLNKEKILMAAFEPRRIISQTIENFENFDDPFVIWKTLFKVHKQWSTLKYSDAKPYIVVYLKSIAHIINELNASKDTLAVWQQQSSNIKLSDRNEPDADFFFTSRFMTSTAVRQQIQSRNYGWNTISETATATALKLADIGLLLSGQ